MSSLSQQDRKLLFYAAKMIGRVGTYRKTFMRSKTGVELLDTVARLRRVAGVINDDLFQSETMELHGKIYKARIVKRSKQTEVDIAFLKAIQLESDRRFFGREKKGTVKAPTAHNIR